MSDKTLIHYGVKGMRWGIRKERKPSLRKRIRTNNRDYKKAMQARSKNYSKQYRQTRNIRNRGKRRNAQSVLRSNHMAALHKTQATHRQRYGEIMSNATARERGAYYAGNVAMAAVGVGTYAYVMSKLT